jgi:hypothetical protein
VGANPHFLVPHQANSISDAYYEAFLRDQLARIRDGSPAVPGQHWGAAAIAAQTIGAMYDAYVLDLVPAMVDEGVELVLWYSFMSDNAAMDGTNGPFGHWDNMDQSITRPVPSGYLDEGAPKAAAIYSGPPRRSP